MTQRASVSILAVEGLVHEQRQGGQNAFQHEGEADPTKAANLAASQKQKLHGKDESHDHSGHAETAGQGDFRVEEISLGGVELTPAVALATVGGRDGHLVGVQEIVDPIHNRTLDALPRHVVQVQVRSSVKCHAIDEQWQLALDGPRTKASQLVEGIGAFDIDHVAGEGGCQSQDECNPAEDNGEGHEGAVRAASHCGVVWWAGCCGGSRLLFREACCWRL